MSWASISVTQVIDEGGFSADEKSTLDTAAGTGADLTNVLANVVASVRGTCEAAGFETGAAGTVPDSLRQDIVAAVRWAWLTSFPLLAQLQTDARKEANDRAQTRFDDIAKGDRGVEPATTAETDAPATGNWGSQTKVHMRTSDTEEGA